MIWVRRTESFSILLESVVEGVWSSVVFEDGDPRTIRSVKVTIYRYRSSIDNDVGHLAFVYVIAEIQFFRSASYVK